MMRRCDCIPNFNESSGMNRMQASSGIRLPAVNPVCLPRFFTALKPPGSFLIKPDSKDFLPGRAHKFIKVYDESHQKY